MTLGELIATISNAESDLRVALSILRDHGDHKEDAFLENDISRAIGAVETALENLRNRT